MRDFIIQLWTDQTFFARIMRTLVFGLGTAITTGVITLGPKLWWLGQLMQVSSLLIGAGDRTSPEVKQLAADLKSGEGTVLAKDVKATDELVRAPEGVAEPKKES